MLTATTLCYVRTDVGDVKKVAEGEPIPADATSADLDRLRAASAIAETKPATEAKRRSSQSGT